MGGGCSPKQHMTTVPTESKPRLPARPAIWVYSPGFNTGEINCKKRYYVWTKYRIRESHSF
jgi:hypothetical protein